MKLIWKITDYCNLSCSHCGESKKMNLDFNQDSREKCISMIDHLFAVFGEKLMEISLLGGEPTLYPAFEYLLQKAELNKTQVSVITNGQTMELIEWFRKYSSLRNVGVSLEGFQKYNDSIRGFGTYEQATELIYELKKVERENSSVFINTTVSKANYGQMQDFIVFWGNMNIAVQLNQMVDTGQAKENWKQFEIDENNMIALYDQLFPIIKNNPNKNRCLEIGISTPYMKMYRRLITQNKDIIQEHKCHAISNELFMNAQYEIAPCEAYEHLKASLENLNSFEDLLGKMSVFYFLLDSNEEHKCNSSEACYFVPYCYSCALADNYDPTVLCTTYKVKIQEYLKKNDLTFRINNHHMKNEDEMKIFYYSTNELVTYEEIGYQILGNEGLNIKNIADGLAIDAFTVATFLFLEESKGHVELGFENKDM